MIVVANCVHLLVALQQRLRAGDSRRDAIVESLKLNLHPVFLASLTTALGFLSMNFSEVPPYRHLGIFVAFGIAASFFLSVAFLPALLSLLPVRASKGGTVPRTWHEPPWPATRCATESALFVRMGGDRAGDDTRHSRATSSTTCWCISSTKAWSFARTRISWTSTSPAIPCSNTRCTHLPRAVPPILSSLPRSSNFAEWYREQPPVRHVAVITDTFQQLNKSMHGDDPAAYRIPESQELAAQYLLLYELSLPQGLDVNNQIDRSRSATRVSVSARDALFPGGAGTERPRGGLAH